MPAPEVTEFAGAPEGATVSLGRPPGSPGADSGRHIGPYRLLRLLGDGGMGEVWLADQLAPVER